MTYALLFQPVWFRASYSILEVSLLAVVGAAIATSRAPSRKSTPVPIGFILLVALMSASLLWSAESWTTFRDAFSFGLLAVAAWLVVARTGIRAVEWGIAASTACVAATSIVFWLVAPDAATVAGTESLQGIYSNRNALGFVLAGGLPALLSLQLRNAGSQVIRLALVGLVVGTIVATTSRTALVVSVVVIGVWLILIAWKRSGVTALALTLLGATAGVAALLNFQWVLSVVAKSETVNGRTVIWGAVWEMIGQRPLLGHGWSRSWPRDAELSDAVAESLNGNVVFHAHNELLNWFVTLGILGIATLVLTYIASFAYSLLGYRNGNFPEAMWPLLTLVATVIRGFSEISETNAQGWYLLALAIFGATRSGYTYAGPMLSRLVFASPSRASVLVTRTVHGNRLTRRAPRLDTSA